MRSLQEKFNLILISNFTEMMVSFITVTEITLKHCSKFANVNHNLAKQHKNRLFIRVNLFRFQALS